MLNNFLVLRDLATPLLEWWNYPLLTIGSSAVTAAGIVKLITLIVLVFIFERWFVNKISHRILKRTSLDATLQYSIERLIGYLVLIVGAYVALQAIGLDLSSFAILAGAVGVGLGFGLQNILNNFVSGLILLAERPIGVGDRIEVAGVAGQVQKISLRSTVVVTNDNIAIIVPNSQLVSETVVNWSHGDARVRIRLDLSVSYGTDTTKLSEVLLAIADQHPKVLKDPAPAVFLVALAENGLNFELAVWTMEMTFSPRRLKSELLFAIEKAFREHNIVVPFPQREVRIKPT